MPNKKTVLHQVEIDPTTSDTGVSSPPAATTPDEKSISIPKQTDEGGLDKFRSKRSPNISGVETLQTALPIYSIADAQDFVRLHPNEQAYWSPEFCFVNVPIMGQKRDQLHLIDEDLAMKYLPSARIKRFRLALATKPHDIFFLCQVPSRNMDNLWNETNHTACLQAKTLWTQATSRRDEGAEGYKIDKAKNPKAFPVPNWPKQTLNQLLTVTFNGRMIDHARHPGLLRLTGDVQSIS